MGDNAHYRSASIPGVRGQSPRWIDAEGGEIGRITA